MKYVNIFRQASGADTIQASWEMFQKLGLPDNAEKAYAAADGKTYVIITDGVVDATQVLSFAPFFEEMTVLPVVEIDDAWAGSAAAAIANLSS